mgnify:CR=1 FL=1
MQRWMMACAIAMAAAGCATTAGATPKVSNADKVALLNGAKVDITDAIKAAQGKAPGRVVDTELRSKGGKTVWEIDVVGADGKVTEVDVDATTGAVTDSE